MDERTSRVEKKVAGLESDTDQLKLVVEKQAEEIRAIKKQLLIDSSRELITNDPTYDRMPDARVLRINTQTAVARQKMQKTCQDWLKDLAGHDWQLVGGEDRPGKFFAVAFKGAGAAGGRQADKALQCLKDANGKW
eukprot:10585797-Karenia_brevis.AAC.1